MSPLKINQSFEKRGLANISRPELAMYSPKGSKPFHPRPPSCKRSDLFWRYVSEHRPKRALGAFRCRCHHKHFITEASDTLVLSAESVNALAYLAGLQCDDDDESVGTPDTDTAHHEQPFIESYPYTSGSDVWPPTAPGTN